MLRPGGRLAVFGHVFQPPAQVAEAFATVYRRVVPNSPFNSQASRPALDIYQEMFSRAADEIGEADGFGALEQWRFDWEQHYTTDDWLDLIPTQGSLTRLPQDTLAEILDGVGTAVDAMGGGFTMPYITLAVTATRTTTASSGGSAEQGEEHRVGAVPVRPQLHVGAVAEVRRRPVGRPWRRGRSTSSRPAGRRRPRRGSRPGAASR